MPEKTSANSPPKLLDQVRGKIRLKHYSIRTEQAYADWIKRFILFFDKRYPRDLGATDVEKFLTHLAVEGKVAASTQNQAKSALLFLYREVLEIELPWLDNVERAKAPKRLPVVLDPAGGASGAFAHPWRRRYTFPKQYHFQNARRCCHQTHADLHNLTDQARRRYSTLAACLTGNQMQILFHPARRVDPVQTRR